MYEKKGGGGGRAGTGFLSILIRLPCLHFRSTIHSSGSSPSFRSIPIFLLIPRDKRVLDETMLRFFCISCVGRRVAEIYEFWNFFSSRNRDKNGENDRLERSRWKRGGRRFSHGNGWNFQPNRRYLVAISYETVTFLTFLREFVSNDFS